MNELKPVLDEARGLQDEIVALRRRLHAEPEVGLELPDTRAKVLAALEGLPLDVTLHRRSSGIVATLRGKGDAPAILLRGDMDALPMTEETGLPFSSSRPGAAHACGHDAHTAMLVGAARILCAHREELPGDVVFMFQPGEEGHFGARVMLEEGLLEQAPEVAAVFAIHIAPQLPCGMVGTRPGPLMASADVFEIEVLGKGGHASMPHDCLDPVPVACEIVQALNTFVTRRIPATDPVVLTVARIQAGTTNNVIAERAQLTGTLRALSERSRELAQEGILRVAEHVARAHGSEARTQIAPGYPVTSNDAGFVDFASGVARSLLGEQGVIPLPTPVMGAEDFSYLLNERPGAMFFLGVCPTGVKDPAPCHSNRMVLEEEGLFYGTALHAAVALRSPQHLQLASQVSDSGA